MELIILVSSNASKPEQFQFFQMTLKKQQQRNVIQIARKWHYSSKELPNDWRLLP